MLDISQMLDCFDFHAPSHLCGMQHIRGRGEKETAAFVFDSAGRSSYAGNASQEQREIKARGVPAHPWENVQGKCGRTFEDKAVEA